jgi:CRP/FNR family transcriptional regulator, cyclic AMP receptor protein
MHEQDRSSASRTATLGLQQIPLLAGLSDAALASVAQQCRWQRFDTGEALIARNADDRSVHLIVTGRVRVTIYSRSGRQVTFRDRHAGEFLGEIAALDGRPRSADAVAVESTLVASLTPEAFTRLRQQQPIVGERLLVHLATLVRGLSDRVIEVSTLGVQNRIHAELLRMARSGDVRDNRARIEPAPRHADLASQVSTYREQVTRELSTLARDGLVAKDGRALVVLDVARLERLVAEVAGP